MQNKHLNILSDEAWKKFIDSLIKPFIGEVYKNPALSREDLKQEAWLGIIKACEKYDPQRGVKFTTYAHYYILGRIIRYINNTRNIATEEVSEEQVFAEYNYDDMGSYIMNLLKSQKHADIFIDYYVNDYTLYDLAKKHNKTPECMRRRINKIMNSIRYKVGYHACQNS